MKNAFNLGTVFILALTAFFISGCSTNKEVNDTAMMAPEATVSEDVEIVTMEEPLPTAEEVVTIVEEVTDVNLGASSSGLGH